MEANQFFEGIVALVFIVRLPKVSPVDPVKKTSPVQE